MGRACWPLPLFLISIACFQPVQDAIPPQQEPQPTRVTAADPPRAAVTGEVLAAESARAEALLYAGEGEAARRIFLKLLQKDRHYAPAYIGLARIEYFRDEPESLERARRLVQHALTLDANRIEAHCLAAWVARARGETEEALRFIESAAALQPHHSEVKLLRAELGFARANIAEMVQFAMEVLEQTDDSRARAAAYRYLIIAYEAGGHLEAAAEARRAQSRHLQAGMHPLSMISAR